MDRVISTVYSEKATHADLSVTKSEDIRFVGQSFDGESIALSLYHVVFVSMHLFPSCSERQSRMAFVAPQEVISGNQEHFAGTDKLTLVMMAGLPGTGKTKLAYALKDELGLQVIDKDLHIMEQKRDDLDDYQAAWNAYKQSFKEVRNELERDSSVILDSAALHQFILDEMVGIVNDIQDVRLKVILCVANRALREDRLHNRACKHQHPKSTMDLTTDVDELQLFQHLPLDRLTLDMSNTFQKNLDKAIAYIRS